MPPLLPPRHPLLPPRPSILLPRPPLLPPRPSILLPRPPLLPPRSSILITHPLYSHPAPSTPTPPPSTPTPPPSTPTPPPSTPPLSTLTPHPLGLNSPDHIYVDACIRCLRTISSCRHEAGSTSIITLINPSTPTTPSTPCTSGTDDELKCVLFLMSIIDRSLTTKDCTLSILADYCKVCGCIVVTIALYVQDQHMLSCS